MFNDWQPKSSYPFNALQSFSLITASYGVRTLYVRTIQVMCVFFFVSRQLSVVGERSSLYANVFAPYLKFSGTFFSSIISLYPTTYCDLLLSDENDTKDCAIFCLWNLVVASARYVFELREKL